MKTAKRMIDVMVKDNTAVVGRTVLKNDGTMDIDQSKVVLAAGYPSAATVMALVGQELLNLSDAGVKDRVAILVPEAVIPRMAEASKAKKDGVSDIGGKLFKEWMAKGEDKDAWAQATNILGAAVAGYEGTIVWVNTRKLYRWEVKSSDPSGANLAGLNGKEVEFIAGVSEEHGLAIEENNRYNRKVTLSVTTIRDRNGNVRYRAFVPRFIGANDAEGKPVWVTATEASDPRRELTTSSDSYASVINALRFHVKTAMALPKTVIANKINVKVVNN